MSSRVHRLHLRVVAALTALAASVVLSGPAAARPGHAAKPTPAVVSDAAPAGDQALTSTPFPVRYRSPDAAYVVSHSADYALVDSGSAFFDYLKVIRLSDGRVLAPVSTAELAETPTLVDDAVGTVTASEVTARSPADQSVLWQLPRSTTYGDEHFDDQWYLHGDSNVGTEIDFPDGATESFPGVRGEWVAGDSDVAILSDGTRSWALDVAADTATELTSADGGPVAVVAADEPSPGDPMTVYGVHGAAVTRWVDPVGDPVGATITLPQAPALQDPSGSPAHFEVAGGRLLATSGSAYAYQVRALDFTEGTWSGPLVSDASSPGAVAQAGTGVVVARTDASSAYLSVLDGAGGRTYVAPIQDPEQAVQVWRSGSQVTATFQETQNRFGSDQLPVAISDGTTWSARTPQRLLPDYNDMAGPSVTQAGGDVVLAGGTLYWPDGRTRAVGDPDTLSADGRYLVYDDASTGAATVTDAATGVTVLQSPRQGAIDGDLFYAGPDASGVVTVSDLTGVATPRTISVGNRCGSLSAGVAAARGRWLELQCGTYSADSAPSWVVVDLLGVVPDFAPTAVVTPALGTDYILTTTFVDPDSSSPDGQERFTVGITALAAGHETRSTGLLGQDGPYFDPPCCGPVVYYPSAVVDGTGGHDPVYVDGDGRVQDIDVSWVPAPALPAPDTTAPTMTITSGGLPLVATLASTRVSFVVAGSDDTTPPADLAVEVQARRAPAGGGFGPWTDVPRVAAAQGLSLASGQELCYRARATAAAANTGGWTAARCTVAPQDDRSVLGPASVVTRGRGSGYLGSTWTELRHRGPGARLPATGTVVALHVVRSPRGGVLLVGGGGDRPPTRVGLRAARRSLAWVVVRMSRPFGPELHLRAEAGSVVRIDAVAVGR